MRANSSLCSPQRSALHRRAVDEPKAESLPGLGLVAVGAVERQVEVAVELLGKRFAGQDVERAGIDVTGNLTAQRGR